MFDNDKHLVKFCQCTFASYLAKMNKDNDDEDDNTELSSNIQSDSNIKEEEV